MGVIAETLLSVLVTRQNTNTNNDPPPGFVEEDGFYVPFWQSRTGIIIKWSIFLGLTTILGLYLVLGHMHARRRIRKGLRPMAYHRWLINRTELATVDPRYAYAARAEGYLTHRPEYYGMHAMPPPTYDPNAPRPPVYEGPEGATKVDPSQRRDEPTHRPADQQAEEYSAPPGPPPAVTANHTGSSNNPYRL